MTTTKMKQKTDSITEFIWLKVAYHFHIFHYRMPETAAIAAVTPFVPSPLTVKMAMIASLLQLGDVNGAEILAKHMHEIEVRITPPKAAISFKAFLRYRSPPAVDSRKELDETGSYYPLRPHMREYAIFQDNLEVYVKFPSSLAKYVEKALKNVRYLGSKDSMVTCFDISKINKHPREEDCINKLDKGLPGIVILLADFNLDKNKRIRDIKDIIPSNRKENMYITAPHTIPGKIKTKGRTKIFISNRIP